MQNVIVSGGSRGLGLAMARTLAAAGYRIIALARASTDELTAASRAAAEAGRGADFLGRRHQRLDVDHEAALRLGRDRRRAALNGRLRGGAPLFRGARVSRSPRHNGGFTLLAHIAVFRTV